MRLKIDLTPNRLTSVDGTTYTWDNNGNLLSDGTRTYTYNHSNQLTGVSQGGVNYSYAYDGLGNRLRQTVGSTVTNYLLDTASGLSQVLADGINTYLYGLGRISQSSASSKEYYLGDALGSVRQLANASGRIVLSRNYEPYGTAYNEMGSSNTAYGFTGEWTDGTGLVNLRARYYAPAQGRFVSKDSWVGDYQDPLSLNKWIYVNGNPINYSDPLGLWRWRLPGNIYHGTIENYYESSFFGLSNPTKQLEYTIPGTPFRHPDMFNSLTGDLYEIEPFFLKSTALSQLQQYQSDLLLAAKAGLLSGNYYGINFDWNSTPFHIGTGVDWPGKFRSPLLGFPAADLVADFVGQGTIIYWIEPNALALVGVPFLVPNKKLVRPQNWRPGQVAPQPAYVISLSEACGYGLIVVGGTIIMVTIVEDVATLGLGTFDDVISIPAGLYFIDLGQRLAVFMPVK